MNIQLKRKTKKLHTIEAKGGKKGCVIVNVQAKVGKWIVVQKHCEKVKKKEGKKERKRNITLFFTNVYNIKHSP